MRMIATLIVIFGIFGWFGRSKKSDPDQAVLEQLKKAGSDLSKPHDIEFFLYFPNESGAKQAATKIKEAGFAVEARPAAQGTGWLCLAKRTMVPELSALQKIRHDFSSSANALGGEYDGWGTGVVN